MRHCKFKQFWILKKQINYCLGMLNINSTNEGFDDCKLKYL